MKDARAKVYDALVVGGGPSGASAAIHLATGGARVLLAERARFPRAKLCGEFISPECHAHFERLGVRDAMSARAGAREVAETVFYAPSGRSVRVPSEWFGVASGARARALGLSRAEMDARLLARAREVGVEVLEDAQAAAVLTDESGAVVGARLNAEGGERTCLARVTLDATGRARAVARLYERESKRRGDEKELRSVGGRESERRFVEGRRRLVEARRRRASLVAFKAHLEGARAEPGACEIYFYRGGYGGLSPVEGGASNLCFITRASDARASASDPARLVREILMSNRRAARALADARVSSAWLSVALEGFGRGSPAPVRGLLAVGDAASFIDPFTGSGMLMAFESGELAAHAVLGRLADVIDDGSALDALARDYCDSYEARFGARLRLCSTLRRAAFAPPPAIEAGVVALGASGALRRRLARATRGAGLGFFGRPA
ncbi:MAG TPA: FAD-dependent monooxygenase [Pyrinomonadaceae bacterium]|nr:FAD-dependent monooxygenase [Pyrinomonadaceae bacterium]